MSQLNDNTTSLQNVLDSLSNKTATPDISIVQTTGDSTTAVMSQKAVTDALNDVATGITSDAERAEAAAEDANTAARDAESNATVATTQASNASTSASTAESKATQAINAANDAQESATLADERASAAESAAADASMHAQNADSAVSAAYQQADRAEAAANSIKVPTALSDLTDDATHRLVTDTEKSTWNAKADASAIPTKVSELDNDSGYITNAPVASVNNKTGAVTLSASDVGALPDTTTIPDSLADLSADATHRTVTDTEKSTWNAKANTSDIPTKVSQLTNDSGYITEYIETDPTVPSWAKATTKPTYTKTEIGLGNVDNVKQYSENNPPPYPVTKVNNKTGAITLSASDVGADASGTASSAVSAHNSNTSAHADIREQISKLSSEKVVLYSEQTLTDEQKEQARSNIGAATQADIDAAVSNIMPEFVDSVDEMTDKAKKYVLTTTGTVWQYDDTITETEVTKTVTDNIVGTTDNPYQTGRLSSGGALSADVTTHTLTPYVDLTKAEYQGKAINIHLEGNRYASESVETYIMSALYDADKNVILGRGYTTQESSNTFDPSCIQINGTTSAIITLSIPHTFSNKTVGFIRFCGLGTVEDSVYITYTDTEIVTSIRGWYDTEVAFSGGGGGSSPDIDINAIAEQAAALVDANLLSMIGSGEVSV